MGYKKSANFIKGFIEKICNNLDIYATLLQLKIKLETNYYDSGGNKKKYFVYVNCYKKPNFIQMFVLIIMLLKPSTV